MLHVLCAFVVRLQPKSGFLASRPMYTLVPENHIVLDILQNGENQSWEEYYRSVHGNLILYLFMFQWVISYRLVKLRLSIVYQYNKILMFYIPKDYFYFNKQCRP